MNTELKSNAELFKVDDWASEDDSSRSLYRQKINGFKI